MSRWLMSGSLMSSGRPNPIPKQENQAPNDPDQVLVLSIQYVYFHSYLLLLFSQSPVNENELEKKRLERKRKASGQPENDEINSVNVDSKLFKVEHQGQATDQNDRTRSEVDSKNCKSPGGQPAQAPGVPGPSSRKGSA